MSKERKVKLFIASMVVMSIALLIGKITGGEYTNGISILYSSFVLGNAVEHYTNK